MIPARSPQFPSSSGPRTWLLTSSASPLGLVLARALLAHGNNVVLGASPSDLDIHNNSRRARDFRHFVRVELEEEHWNDKCIVTQLDARIVGQCQASVAEAAEKFGTLDVLCCCTSEAIVGTVEELAASRRTLTLVRDQVERNFFGPINVIKAALPASHLGTPGLGAFCASGWALEGFCDSLAYEVAPFNIKVTIVQPNFEINVLANKISSVPLLARYTTSTHPAPLARGIIGRLLDRIYDDGEPVPDKQEPKNLEDAGNRSQPSKSESPSGAHRSLSSTEEISCIVPGMPPSMLDPLLAETVHALTAIGGHENPPARHIVGFEAVACVKEKLKTVSEELEDFVEASSAVDIGSEET